MFFTNTTEAIVQDKSKESNDLILEKNGRYVKFSNEVSQYVVENRSSDNQFTLHQSVMSIECHKSIDFSTILQSVRGSLEKASIQWNLIAINPLAADSSQPAVFKNLKQQAIVIAAKKAGVIPGSGRVILIGLCCAAVISVILGGFTKVLIAHEPLSAVSLMKAFNGALFDPVVTGIAISAFTLLSIIFYLLFRNFQTHSPKVQKRIAAAIETISNNHQADAPFIGAVKDRILALPMPMALCIAGFDRLDFFSRSVFQTILSASSDDTVGVLLWILCEHEEPSGNEHGYVPKKQTNHHYRFVDRQS